MNLTAQILEITPEPTEVEVLKQEAVTFYDTVKGQTITTVQDYEQAREGLLEVKSRLKKIDEKTDPMKAKTWEAHQATLAFIKEAKAPYLEAEIFFKKEISRFLTAEEIRRKAEENRLRLIAEKEAEERRLEAALRAEEEGDIEEMEATLNEVPAFVPPPIVPRTVQTGNGIQMREVWTCEVTDLKALVKAVAEGKVAIVAIQANTTFLGQQARSLKGSMNYPGVKVWATKNIAAGRR
jgi:hypothetical protein